MTAALAALLPVVAQTAPAGAVPGSGAGPLAQGVVAAVLVLMFGLLVRETAHRVLVVFAAAALLLLLTYLTPLDLIPFAAATAAVDFNVLFLLAGMMAVVGVLKTTGVFPWAVARVLAGAGGRPWVVQAAIVWFTGILSAVADNVTTVIFVTPLALAAARHSGVRPAAYLIPMVMAANVGGTATLIGDPPNILIASGAGLAFMDFIANLTAPVLVMMVLVEVVGRWYYRRELAAADGRRPVDGPAPVVADPVLLRWSVGIGVVIFLGFATHALTHMPVAVPALAGAAALLVVQDVLYLRRHRPSHEERVHGLIGVIEHEIEWPTLSFFAFLFIVVGAAVHTGLIDTLANGLVAAIRWGDATLGLSPRGMLLLAALLICLASGALSAVVDNIPFVAVTIPIVGRLAGELPGDTQVLWWALALGACLGGNGSPIGASANVTVLGLAEREGPGTAIGFREFLRHASLVTGLTLAVAAGFLTAFVLLGPGRAREISVVLLAGLAVWRVTAIRRALRSPAA